MVWRVIRKRDDVSFLAHDLGPLERDSSGRNWPRWGSDLNERLPVPSTVFVHVMYVPRAQLQKFCREDKKDE